MPILFCVTPDTDESNLDLSRGFCNPDDYDCMITIDVRQRDRKKIAD